METVLSFGDRISKGFWKLCRLIADCVADRVTKPGSSSFIIYLKGRYLSSAQFILSIFSFCRFAYKCVMRIRGKLLFFLLIVVAARPAGAAQQNAWVTVQYSRHGAQCKWEIFFWNWQKPTSHKVANNTKFSYFCFWAEPGYPLQWNAASRCRESNLIREWLLLEFVLVPS